MSALYPAFAQEVLPSTPPELEDFRLDKPPPRENPPVAQPEPQPEPEPQPKTQTPAPPPRTDADRPAPARQRNAPASTVPDVPPNTLPPAIGDSGTGPDTATPQTDAAPPVQTDSAVSASDAVDRAPWQTWLQYWPFLAALLAAFFAVGIFRFLKKRSGDNRAVAVAPVSRPVPVPAKPGVKTPTPLPVRNPKPPAIAPSLSAHFANGDARLSLANLTITGQLHLNYTGPKPIGKITMRTFVMSASDGQAESIAAFHNDDAQGDREILGDMAPGESISVKLELQVPRGALQAFDWRDRRFVAPIVLVNIASDDPAVAPCRLACVVGQAGNADSPRLLPIPIDRGPKRFEGVQFQPIAA